MNKLRSDLPPDMPASIGKLSIDERGYPVPWFVHWFDGKPDFRVADGDKWSLAMAQRLCWVCGQKIRGPKAFVIGPMCAINRCTQEPPCHIDCAKWSVRACPFMLKPKMVRRENQPEHLANTGMAGIGLDRNPGAWCVWVTPICKVFRDPQGGRLIRIGEPVEVSWWAEGRPATWVEIDHSIVTGLPLLKQACHDRRELEELASRTREVYETLLPIREIS